MQVRFTYCLAFEDGTSTCNASTTGSLVTNLSSEHWYCTNGCGSSSLVTDNCYFCAGADDISDWELGEKEFTFKPPGKQFTIG